MDEIKSVIAELPLQDIAILKTMYNPDAAKSDLSDNAQRIVVILDGLSPEEQQEAVNVTPSEQIVPEEEAEAPATELPAEEVEAGEQVPAEAEQEQTPNPAGNLEDFLI